VLTDNSLHREPVGGATVRPSAGSDRVIALIPSYESDMPFVTLSAVSDIYVRDVRDQKNNSNDNVPLPKNRDTDEPKSCKKLERRSVTSNMPLKLKRQHCKHFCSKT